MAASNTEQINGRLHEQNMKALHQINIDNILTWVGLGYVDVNDPHVQALIREATKSNK